MREFFYPDGRIKKDTSPKYPHSGSSVARLCTGCSGREVGKGIEIRNNIGAEKVRRPGNELTLTIKELLGNFKLSNKRRQLIN